MRTNVLAWLEESAARFADKPAFVDEHQSLTYAQVLAAARSVGSRLVRSIERGNPVAVLMERGALTPACFLGVVYAGGFYVPLDTQMPAHRLELIFETLQPAAILADAASLPRVSKLADGVEVIAAEEAAAWPVDDEALHRVRQTALDTDPLLCIYTSGSTGVPKGVLKNHRSVLAFIHTFCETFGIDHTDVIGGQASFDFDISTKDIYTTLACGSTLRIIPKRAFSFPGVLAECMNGGRVTTICWSASAMRITASLGVFKAGPFRHLRRALFAGETLPIKYLQLWQRYMPDVFYVNLYGPTEMTGNCTYYPVEGDLSEDVELPIGKPFMNAKVLVLDENNAPVRDQVGEICILGPYLASGYYRMPALTAAAFVQNPLNPHYPEVMYRTGDYAKYNGKGELLFCGRRDDQVKHMGYRIELGEIETAANAIEGMLACCALYDQEKQQILLLHESEGLSERDIMLALRRKLPKWMCPHRIVSLESMPMNNNGKIDRARLREEYLDAAG